MVLMWMLHMNDGKVNENYISINRDEFATYVIFLVSHASMVIIMFLYDAIPVSINVKRISMVGFMVGGGYDVIEAYFTAKDFEWNPLDFEYFVKCNFILK